LGELSADSRALAGWLSGFRLQEEPPRSTFTSSQSPVLLVLSARIKMLPSQNAHRLAARYDELVRALQRLATTLGSG
jgi:hypothetical protein